MYLSMFYFYSPFDRRLLAGVSALSSGAKTGNSYGGIAHPFPALSGWDSTIPRFYIKIWRLVFYKLNAFCDSQISVSEYRRLTLVDISGHNMTTADSLPVASFKCRLACLIRCLNLNAAVTCPPFLSACEVTTILHFINRLTCTNNLL